MTKPKRNLDHALEKYFTKLRVFYQCKTCGRKGFSKEQAVSHTMRGVCFCVPSNSLISRYYYGDLDD